VFFQQASAPTANGVGDLWYDTDDELLYRWNGSSWALFAPAGGDTVSNTTASNTGTTTVTTTISRTGTPVTLVIDVELNNGGNSNAGIDPFPLTINLKRGGSGGTLLKTWTGLQGVFESSLNPDIAYFDDTLTFVDTDTGTGSTDYYAEFSVGTSYTEAIKLTALTIDGS
jgi:hypothetical protein